MNRPRPHQFRNLKCAQSRTRPALRCHASAAQVPLTIEVKKKVQFGEVIHAIGNDKALGAWDISKSVTLKWTEGDKWTGTLQIPVGQQVKFKLVKVGAGASDWESGNDRELTALGPEYGLRALCSWNDTQAMQIQSFKTDGSSPLPSSSEESNSKPSTPSLTDMMRSSSSSSASYSSPLSSLSSLDEEARSKGGAVWVGAKPEFVKARKDASRKERQWITKDLNDGPSIKIVKGDEKAANWLSKLGLVKELLVDQPKMMRPASEELAACYVYMTWVSTGAVECTESGAHYRPNHHATLSLQIFRSLEWVLGDASQMYSPAGSLTASNTTTRAVMAARRMQGRLPSISGEFRQSVPLTRIRDIAHRSDIPHDLKQEIKHTLQNKLHRSAGPEDLIASEAMLKRITARPGEYNQAFVDEFKIFMKELREFFNASALEELIEKTKGSLDDAHASALAQLTAAKSRVESASQPGAKGPSLDDLMALLFSATQARTFYVAGLSAGLRNDVTEEALEMRQRWRLVELRLEEYCFVVLSRIIAALEVQNKSSPLSKAGNNAWALPLSALTAGLRNLGLSQFKPKELLALESELQAWHSLSPLVQSGKDNALRAKASVDRVLRLSGEYSDMLMNIYTSPSSDLGKGLGIASHMSSVFGESEVRSSVAFQVSRLASFLSRVLREAAGQSAWDGLVTGTAVGILKEVPSLDPEVVQAAFGGKGSKEGWVIVVNQAQGDEELGPLVPLGLRGVILRQELPHLSHLGVRARQEKVTFATLDDAALYDSEVRPLVGGVVKLKVAPEGISLTASQLSTSSDAPTTPGLPSGVNSSSPSKWSAGKRVSQAQVIPLIEATDESCGAKAARCADLERLAATSKGLFKTPKGCCLPFGTLELVVKGAGQESEFTACLTALEAPSLDGAALEAACLKMRQLIESLEVPSKLLEDIRKVFASGGGQGPLLAVRSSANVEDLAGMSAAGLYESVVGVPAYDLPAVSKATSQVWASLFTRRAVMSRRVSGVLQSAASMAVLLQEVYCPKVSFVLHTARPSDNNKGVLMLEAAPGQGETLAAATNGTPWRLEVDRSSGAVSTLAFANFSRALVVNPAATGGLIEAEVDYSRQRISVDVDYRKQFAQRLMAVGSTIEAYFENLPQDIEGGLVIDGPVTIEGPDLIENIYVFQSRPM